MIAGAEVDHKMGPKGPASPPERTTPSIEDAADRGHVRIGEVNTAQEAGQPVDRYEEAATPTLWGRFVSAVGGFFAPRTTPRATPEAPASPARIVHNPLERRELLEGLMQRVNDLFSVSGEPLELEEAHSLFREIEEEYRLLQEGSSIGHTSSIELYMWYHQAKFLILGRAHGWISDEDYRGIASNLEIKFDDMLNPRARASMALRPEQLRSFLLSNLGFVEAFPRFVSYFHEGIASRLPSEGSLAEADLPWLQAYADLLQFQLGFHLPLTSHDLEDQESTHEFDRIVLESLETLNRIERRLNHFHNIEGMGWQMRMDIAEEIATVLRTTDDGEGSPSAPAAGGSGAQSPGSSEGERFDASAARFAGFAESTEEASEAEGTLPMWLLEEDASLDPVDAAAEGAALLLQGGPAVAPAGSAARSAAR